MRRVFVLLAACFFAGMISDSSASVAADVRGVLREKAITGGIIIHLDCGGGERTGELRLGERFIVQGLDRNRNKVSAARARLRTDNSYGPVSVRLYDGRQLPYINRSVNVVVAESTPTVSTQEILRVLAPGGVALIRQGDGWKNLTKDRSAKTDDWTHYLYDATGNAVSEDTEVAPPFFIQWYSGPKWARSHDRLTSMPALVSSAGRIYHIIDEGLTADIILPADWKLVARDAYNGMTLWKKDIERWENHLRAFRSGPTQQPRRLVADGNKLYAALNLGDAVQVLDGSTGQMIKTFAGTEDAEELILSKGNLFVVVDSSRLKGTDDTSRYDFTGRDDRGRTRGYRDYYQKAVIALDARTGRVLWRRDDKETGALLPSTLIADSRRVYYQNDNNIIALDRKSGDTLWTSARDKVRNRDSYNAPALLVADGVVLSADRSSAKKDMSDARPWLYSATAKNSTGELLAFDAETGAQLWSVPCAEAYGATQDVFVINGLVYVGQNARRHRDDFARAYDLRTGREKLQLDSAPAFVTNHHHRCWRNKATPNYILMGRTGIEFIDVTGKDTVKNSWTRGACQYGIMPANGLVYTPPHSCGCYIQVKLSGFFAYAPESQKPPFKTNRFTNRLVEGPAYGRIANRKSRTVNGGDWPTYRQDPSRSGYVAAEVGPEVERKWTLKFDGPITGPVSAGGVVYLAEKNQHAVRAVSAADGKKLWSFVADGYIDSPPTVWKGMVLFGTRGGSVYALDAADGTMAWQFLAGKANIQQVFDGRLESLWPVHGSVLVKDGGLFFAAGRSSYVDDGLYLYKLDPKTGELLNEKRIFSRDKSGRPAESTGGRGKQSYPGGLSDILSADEEHVFMRDVTFTPDVKMLEPTIPHIHSAAGYLDDSWAHRTYWFLGTYMDGGYGGWGRQGNRKYSGRIMVRDENALFGYGRTNYFNDFWSAPNLGRYRNQELYQLYAAPLNPDQQDQPNKAGQKNKKGQLPYTWKTSVPVYVRAMVLARNALFIAGPKQILEDETADDPQVLDKQTAWLKGMKGAELYAVSPESGERLAATELPSPPVFDGMIAAEGNLYLSTMANSLICIGQ